ncbi:NADH-ubiquinone oxidoreductase-F iron-sulfur binding region domain-containing protein [Sporomusa malonica]|uniref:NADH-quinone oxidoreductase subunit F n=1 Tax=Sporomusa malonica TaxID=112901 RepID=A0A1W1YML6_9FIRM|nr:NADH-ubiquinone oxidoreductase-F iron-sulfur binding region domain-containing protein [Sporomusa malonica]SMC37366.1 NADH-quinone oxidoreductase subunit F [Sporomusa malonica]
MTGRVHVPLKSLAEEGKITLCDNKSRINVGTATCGRAAGALEFYNNLEKRDWNEKAGVYKVGCLGSCYAEPLVNIRTPDGKYYFFGNIDTNSFWRIVKTAEEPPGSKMSPYLWAVAQERKPGILGGIQDLELIKIANSGFSEFFQPQVRRISGRCGLIDPESIAEYVAMGGYLALEKALFKLKRRTIIDMIGASGLRGRGGAGFPTGEKWDIAYQSPDPVRYVIANADEGDPGAYMDRALLESDPHSVLEGLMIAALAVGAFQAYIFVRHEYPLAVQVLRKAMISARKVGFLGNNIMGSNFSLNITLVESGGAFVCGEETSMLQVMLGKRGESQLRPPYPANRGFHDHPTVINNVETLANIPWIILNGAEAFREVGTEKSPGTKIFCLAGDIKRTGFIEVPLGTSTQVLVEKIGAADKESIKALQIGGPSGGIVPYRDFFLDYETVASAGAIMGSGGLVPLNKNRCMVDMARHMTNFMGSESCGKCSICRGGLLELEARLLTLTMGKGYKGILEEIEELSKTISQVSLCGLGQTATNPVSTTITYFRDEYEAHVKGKCPAVSCKPLIDFEIILPCKECKACYQVCPTEAVKMRGVKTERFVVDSERCIKCWACYETCPFNSIRITSEEFTWKN